MDNKTTLQELKEELRAFRDEREWEQFHKPKDLAMSITVEASELLELFLWLDEEEVQKRMDEDETFRNKVHEEIGDVFITAYMFAIRTGLDISDVVREKLKKTAKKYPVEKAKGVSTKYTDL